MKTRKPKLNVRLLRRVKRHILAEPKRLLMAAYVMRGTPRKKFDGDNGQQSFPQCGTVGCIAGWACLLSGNGEEQNAFDPAAALLNLTDPSKLFFEGSWPLPFADQYQLAKTPAKRAKIAAARIEHLITTGE